MRKLLLLFALVLALAETKGQVVVASKNFPESSVLAELIAQTIEQNTELTVERKFGLGGTLICYEALKGGEIDIYPEYTGTALTAILKIPYRGKDSDEVLSIVRDKLEENQLHVGPLFGFNNTYVLATRPELNLKRISDLKGRDQLRYGFSNEFTQREDGFSGINKAYGLGLNEPRGLDHGLAYKALADGTIDITDAYSTDGKLSTFGFQLLEDDRNFFPPYYAFPLIREETIARFPELQKALKTLEDQLDEEAMRALNFRYEVNGEDLSTIAFEFLNEKGIANERPKAQRMHPVVKQTIDHLKLTLLATLIAVLLAVPLGIAIIGKMRLANVVMATTGAVQTIPSLALLGFMIPLFGIGFLPAVIALFLYALLPILRNTYTGLQETDPILIEAGKAMGMTKNQILFQLRLPLASDVIMAGIRTALTINIGTATLAAFIGAGGLGESIITGITLNDNEMILQGAIPAALLALIADRLMLLLQKKLTPKRA